MSVLSPELALVDPELRARAVAGLPRVQPYAFLELRPLPVVEEPPLRAPTFSISAAGAYLLLAIARTAAFDAVVFLGVFACVLLANLFA
jgi:hypothetical protein